METQVVVLDFDQNTKEQYLAMRANDDHTPVIFLADKKSQAELEALKICCGGHLFHPVTQGELSSLVQEMKKRDHNIHCC